MRSASSGEKVAARLSPPEFDQDHVEVGEALAHVGDRGEVDRSVLADGGMRAAARLDPHDPLGRQRPRLDQDARVLLGVDVVGDRGDVERVPEPLAKLLHQRRLAGADRAADADAEGVFGLGHWGSDRRLRGSKAIIAGTIAERAPVGFQDRAACAGRSAVVEGLQNGAFSEPMPVNLSIKNAPDEVVERLRRRAERNHRSLQGEMLAILEDAVRPERSLSPGELLAEVPVASFWRTCRSGGHRQVQP